MAAAVAEAVRACIEREGPDDDGGCANVRRLKARSARRVTGRGARACLGNAARFRKQSEISRG